MCGGAGTRLESAVEKPLVEVCDVPMVERVRRAVAGSRVDRVHAAVSPQTPATRDVLRRRSCTVVETSGAGYVDDLDDVLNRVGRPVLTVAADLPLLAPGVIDQVIATARRTGEGSEPNSLAVCVPATLKRRLGLSVDDQFDHEGQTLAPSGCNVVGAGPDTIVTRYDVRLAVNVNRPGDLRVAERLCETLEETEQV